MSETFVGLAALSGKADSADLTAWMARRFARAWDAFSQAYDSRGSRLVSGGEQADEALQECLGAAIAAWEAFDGF